MMRTSLIRFTVLGLVALACASAAAEGEWGPVRKGYTRGFRTRLVPLQEEFRLGKAMIVQLEMLNDTESPRAYNCQQISVNNPLIIKNATGQRMRYVGPVVSTLGIDRTLQPGEETILAQFDLEAYYYIDRPGRYTVQSPGDDACPPSNILAISVVGDPLPIAEVVDRLEKILPEGWSWHVPRSARKPRSQTVVPLGRKPAEGFYVRLVRDYPVSGAGVHVFRGRASLAATMHIWVVQRPADVIGEEEDHLTLLSAYIGRSPWGEVYLWTSDALYFWPTFQQDIRAALELNSPQPADRP